ncbi:EamA family transporter [Halobacillus yeomjeoni]|uniref:EamA family transporter n=1 Tax=Halobacillus yeomjeoni TaxID=311194 RepID=UPI001F54A7BB|nr:EamA family transporter [Halobacillus yeomjeoni]
MKSIYFLLLSVMMVWGFNVSAIKVLVAEIDPILLTSIRIFTAGVGVLIALSFMKILRMPTKKELSTICYISLFNVVAHHALMGVGFFIYHGGQWWFNCRVRSAFDDGFIYISPK